MNTADPRFQAEFTERAARVQAELGRTFRHSRVDVIDIQTDQPYVQPLMRFFKEREGAIQMRALVRGAARRLISEGTVATAFLMVFVPASLRAQAPRIFTELDTALVSVGDRMAFTVRVEHDPAAIVVWPDSLDLGSLEVLGAEFLPTDNEGGRSITGARFSLAAFELGDIEIPSFDIRVETPDGSSTTLSTDPYVITVQSVGLDEEGDIRAIRGPLGIPLSVIYVLPWILLLALLGGLGYWLWVKRRAR